VKQKLPGNQSDQDKQKVRQSLMDELGVESLKEAEDELVYENQRRLNLCINSKTIQEVDLRIFKLKRVIGLLRESG